MKRSSSEYLSWDLVTRLDWPCLQHADPYPLRCQGIPCLASAAIHIQSLLCAKASSGWVRSAFQRPDQEACSQLRTSCWRFMSRWSWQRSLHLLVMVLFHCWWSCYQPIIQGISCKSLIGSIGLLRIESAAFAGYCRIGVILISCLEVKQLYFGFLIQLCWFFQYSS